jgi:hypothetical protein
MNVIKEKLFGTVFLRLFQLASQHKQQSTVFAMSADSTLLRHKNHQSIEARLSDRQLTPVASDHLSFTSQRFHSSARSLLLLAHSRCV